MSAIKKSSLNTKDLSCFFQASISRENVRPDLHLVRRHTTCDDNEIIKINRLGSSAPQCGAASIDGKLLLARMGSQCYKARRIKAVNRERKRQNFSQSTSFHITTSRDSSNHKSTYAAVSNNFNNQVGKGRAIYVSNKPGSAYIYRTKSRGQIDSPIATIEPATPFIEISSETLSLNVSPVHSEQASPTTLKRISSVPVLSPLQPQNRSALSKVDYKQHHEEEEGKISTLPLSQGSKREVGDAVAVAAHIAVSLLSMSDDVDSDDDEKEEARPEEYQATTAVPRPDGEQAAHDDDEEDAAASKTGDEKNNYGFDHSHYEPTHYTSANEAEYYFVPQAAMSKTDSMILEEYRDLHTPNPYIFGKGRLDFIASFKKTPDGDSDAVTLSPSATSIGKNSPKSIFVQKIGITFFGRDYPQFEVRRSRGKLLPLAISSSVKSASARYINASSHSSDLPSELTGSSCIARQQTSVVEERERELRLQLFRTAILARRMQGSDEDVRKQHVPRQDERPYGHISSHSALGTAKNVLCSHGRIDTVLDTVNHQGKQCKGSTSVVIAPLTDELSIGRTKDIKEPAPSLVAQVLSPPSMIESVASEQQKEVDANAMQTSQLSLSPHPEAVMEQASPSHIDINVATGIYPEKNFRASISDELDDGMFDGGAARDNLSITYSISADTFDTDDSSLMPPISSTPGHSRSHSRSRGHSHLGIGLPSPQPLSLSRQQQSNARSPSPFLLLQPLPMHVAKLDSSSFSASPGVRGSGAVGATGSVEAMSPTPQASPSKPIREMRSIISKGTLVYIVDRNV